MAEVTVSPTDLSRDSEQAIDISSNGTSVSTGNTAVIDCEISGDLLIYVYGDGGTTTATVQASDTFSAAGQGTYQFTADNTNTQMIILSGDRFKKADGNIDIAITNNNSKIQAFNMPK